MSARRDRAIAEAESDYILLGVAAGIIRHRKPRKFRLAMEAYEWLFNQRCVSESSLTDVAHIIYLSVNDRLDIDDEQARLRGFIDGGTAAPDARQGGARHRASTSK